MEAVIPQKKIAPYGHHWFRLPMGLLLASILILICGPAEAYMVGKNPYRRVEMLDSEGKYRLEFQVDKSKNQITFNVTVQTRGWVGFGLSAEGKMSGADIVIGGVLSNGESYFSDRHAVGNQVPEQDQSQDWELHEARANGTHTFLSFSRALDTCDPQDYAIVEDKVSLIWAYGERDDQLSYHYTTRGEYPIHLLNPDYSPPIERDAQTNFPLVVHNPFEQDVRVWSWNVAYVMPTDHTTYWCSLRKGPVLSRKHHMIGFEVRFKDEISREHLHHVIISKCRAPPGFTEESLFGKYLNQGQLCYGAGGRSNSARMEATGPIRTEYCIDYLHMSVVGNRISFLPPHLGTPFGEEAHEYYLIQAHYDNPNEQSGVRVEANLDIFYTPQLRTSEGGLMVVRHESPGLPPSHLTPPSSIAQKAYSVCGSECTKKMLPEQGIRIPFLLLHGHNSGVGMRLRHFRGDRELSPIAIEDNFSFDFQQMRALPKEAHVLPGDQMVFECTTDNTWTNGTVMGGFSTRQEMCAAWVFYYNKLPNHMLCASEIDAPEFRQSFLGIQNVSWSTPHLEYVATSPRSIAGLPVSKVSDMLEWTVGKREQLNQFLLSYPHSNRCPVEAYARAHTRDKNGEPVDLEPEQNLAVLTPLPALTGFYNPPKTCAQRREVSRLAANYRQASRANREKSNDINNKSRDQFAKSKNVPREINQESFGGWEEHRREN